jgi:hypothetical protein
MTLRRLWLQSPHRAVPESCPETTPRACSPRPTTQPSAAPLTCAVVWAREVLHFVVNTRASMVRRGRRFESVRGICKVPANRGLPYQLDLHHFEHASGMEPIMELPDQRRCSPSPRTRRSPALMGRPGPDPPRAKMTA